jgi:hypothetical protein
MGINSCQGNRNIFGHLFVSRARLYMHIQLALDCWHIQCTMIRPFSALAHARDDVVNTYLRVRGNLNTHDPASSIFADPSSNSFEGDTTCSHCRRPMLAQRQFYLVVRTDQRNWNTYLAGGPGESHRCTGTATGRARTPRSPRCSESESG